MNIRYILLTYIIVGCIFFILSLTYFDQTILLISLSQMMVGSVGLYILDNPKNSPIVYK